MFRVQSDFYRINSALPNPSTHLIGLKHVNDWSSAASVRQSQRKNTDKQRRGSIYMHLQHITRVLVLFLTLVSCQPLLLSASGTFLSGTWSSTMLLTMFCLVLPEALFHQFILGGTFLIYINRCYLFHSVVALTLTNPGSWIWGKTLYRQLSSLAHYKANGLLIKTTS